jgi:hypothetical protein
MVNLSKFLVDTSLQDLKLGFECEKVSQDIYFIIFSRCGFGSSAQLIMCLSIADLGSTRMSDEKVVSRVPPTKVCVSR